LLDDRDDELLTYYSQPVDVEYDPDYWIANNESVPILPSFYHVLPSSVSIPNGRANLIAGRIKKILRDRSIVATYHSFGAKADCTTKYHVRFRIRLYRGKGADRDTIIVEIQRLEGFEVMFQKDVYAIFDAAEGRMADPLLDEVEPTFDIANDDDDDMYTQSTLDLVANILFPGDGKADDKQIQIAISVLMSATNPGKVGREAIRISRIFLISESSTRVRDFIVSNACSFNVEPSLTTRYKRVKHQSLEILANISSCLHSVLEETSNLPLMESLFPHLIYLVENASVDPQAASWACLILKNINLSQSLDNEECIRLKDTLSDARTYGNKAHGDLERHSLECGMMLDGIIG
jgi:hypothetical protein